MAPTHESRTTRHAAIACLPFLLLARAVSAFEPAAELLAERMTTPMLTRTQGTITGEDVCWHAAYHSNRFVDGARQTGDLAYLEAGVTYFDALMAKLHTSPDGWRGWVGPYIYGDPVYADVHVGDAILVRAMLDLAEYIRTEVPAGDRPQLEEAAQRYIDLAEEICAKWEVRGTWHDVGRYGGYVSWDQFLAADRLEAFQTRHDVLNARIALPFNKQQSMGTVHLRLYRIAGDPEHRRKAQLIFAFLKYRLSAFGDGYTWDYWEPFYPGDVVSLDPPRLAHWVNTHPYRSSYQMAEVSEIVEAYHSGLVYGRDDIESLVRTNRRMWNGSLEEPDWENSDAAANRAAVPGWVPPPPAHGYTRLAGDLWHALAPFDAALAKLAGMEATNTALARRYDLPVTEVDWPAPPVTALQLGCALPPRVAPGDTVLLVSKARAPGALRIALMDASGQREVTTLWSGQTPGGLDGLEGIAIQSWTADVAAGSYRVRWVWEGDGRRERRDDPLEIR